MNLDFVFCLIFLACGFVMGYSGYRDVAYDNLEFCLLSQKEDGSRIRCINDKFGLNGEY